MIITPTNHGSWVAEQRASDGVLVVSEASTLPKAVVSTLEALRQHQENMGQLRLVK